MMQEGERGKAKEGTASDENVREEVEDAGNELRVRIEGDELIESVDAVIPKKEPKREGTLVIAGVLYEEEEYGLLPSVTADYYRPGKEQYASYVWLGKDADAPLNRTVVQNAGDACSLKEMKNNTKTKEGNSLLYYNPGPAPPKLRDEEEKSLRSEPPFDLVSIVRKVAPQDIEIPSDLETDVPAHYPSSDSPIIEEFAVDPEETNVRAGPGFELNLLLLGHPFGPGFNLHEIELEGSGNAVIILFEGGKTCVVADSRRDVETAKQKFLELISLVRDPERLTCTGCERKMKRVPFRRMSRRYLNSLTDEQLTDAKNGLRGYSRCPGCEREIEWVRPSA